MIRTVVATLALASVASAQSVILSQPQVSGTATSISLTEGGNTFGFANRRLADNFSFSDAGTITSLRWWGGNEDNTSPTLTNIQGFNVSIFDGTGAAGAPGTPLFSQDFTLAQTSPTAVPGQTVGLLAAPMFSFSASLSAAFAFSGNTTYWLSVAAIRINPVGATDQAFQWAGTLATNTDTLIAQDRFGGLGWQLQTLSRRNAAFELTGTVIPAPGSIALLAAGALFTRRRR